MAKKITLTNSVGEIVQYSPGIHRQAVIAKITESDLWPDLPECENRAEEIFTQYADYDEEDFLELTDEEMRRFAFAQTQQAKVNVPKLAAERLDAMIANGDIVFATDEDRLAMIVPEPDDPNDLPTSDTRHPIHKVKVEIK